jgi:hypothetical protein
MLSRTRSVKSLPVTAGPAPRSAHDGEPKPGTPTAVDGAANLPRWHRIRFYEGKWSNFDGIEKCGAPGPCFLCNTKHSFCTERGAVMTNAPAAHEPEGA